MRASHGIRALVALIALTACLLASEASICPPGESTAVLKLASSARVISRLAGSSGMYQSENPFVGKSTNKTCASRRDLLVSVDLKPPSSPNSPATLCIWWLGNLAAYCEDAPLTPVCLDLQPDGSWGAKVSTFISANAARQAYTGHTLTITRQGELRYRALTYSSMAYWEVGGWESLYSTFDVRLKLHKGCLFGKAPCRGPTNSTFLCDGCTSCTTTPKIKCPNNTYRSEAKGYACLPCKAGTKSPAGSTSSRACEPASSQAGGEYANSWKCITKRDSRLGIYQGTPFRWNGFHPECPTLDGKHCLLDRTAKNRTALLKSCKQVLKEIPGLRRKQLLRPLSCGGEHAAVWGYTGYNYPVPAASRGTVHAGHWCNVAWEEFVGYAVGKDALYNCIDCSPQDAPANATTIKFEYIDVMALSPANAPRLPGDEGSSGSGGTPGGYGDSLGPGGYGA